MFALGQSLPTFSTPVPANARFSNRPFRVKRFQTIHHSSVDVAHGLALLFGLGTRALPVWDSRTRRNNLLRGLTVRVTAGPSGHANSPHPSSREGHLSTISLKRSTHIHQRSTRRPADYPICYSNNGQTRAKLDCPLSAMTGHWAFVHA